MSLRRRHNHWVKYTNWECDARVPLIFPPEGAAHLGPPHPVARRARRSVPHHGGARWRSRPGRGARVVRPTNSMPWLEARARGSGSGSGSGSGRSFRIGWPEWEFGRAGLKARATPRSSPPAPGLRPRSGPTATTPPSRSTLAAARHNCRAAAELHAAVRCASVAKTDFAHMGFSMRTSRERSKPCPSSFVAIGPESQGRELDTNLACELFACC